MPSNQKQTISIIVHGGAYAIPTEIKEPSVQGCQTACKKGFEKLLKGFSAVDAVEAAIRCLEDNEVFDAGTGSVLVLSCLFFDLKCECGNCT